MELLDNFKEMRTDYGLKMDPKIKEKLYPDVVKLHQELQKRKKLHDWSHGLFVKTEKYNKILYNTGGNKGE